MACELGRRFALVCLASAALLAACSGAPVKEQELQQARSELAALKSDPNLASRAPEAIEEAEQALRAAEKRPSDATLAAHLVYLAERKVATARALAEARVAEDQVQALQEQYAPLAQAQRAKARAQLEQRERQLSQQLADLQPRQTARGLALSLPATLFVGNGAALTPAAETRLDLLADFLAQTPARRIEIAALGEGEAQYLRAQKRAAAVRDYLLGRGLDEARLAVEVAIDHQTPGLEDVPSGGVMILIAPPEEDPVPDAGSGSGSATSG
jgi:outer membrane protein OmpA-like peptidoglycan-associated protein